MLAHCLSPILLCQCCQVRGSAEFLSTYYMSGTAISTRDPEGNWCGQRMQCLLAQQRGLPACDWVTWGRGAKGSWYLCGGVAEAVLNWGQVNVFLFWVPCSLDCTRVHCVWPGPWTGGSLDPRNFGQITSCVSLTSLNYKKKKILSPKCSLGYFIRNVSRGVQCPSSFSSQPDERRHVLRLLSDRSDNMLLPRLHALGPEAQRSFDR